MFIVHKTQIKFPKIKQMQPKGGLCVVCSWWMSINPFTVNPELSRPTQMHRTAWSPS